MTWPLCNKDGHRIQRQENGRMNTGYGRSQAIRVLSSVNTMQKQPPTCMNKWAQQCSNEATGTSRCWARAGTRDVPSLKQRTDGHLSGRRIGNEQLSCGSMFSTSPWHLRNRSWRTNKPSTDKSTGGVQTSAPVSGTACSGCLGHSGGWEELLTRWLVSSWLSVARPPLLGIGYMALESVSGSVTHYTPAVVLSLWSLHPVLLLKPKQGTRDF